MSLDFGTTNKVVLVEACASFMRRECAHALASQFESQISHTRRSAPALKSAREKTALPGDWTAFLEDRFLYSGGTDSLENFTAEFSASAPVVYKNPPPMGPEIYTPLVRERG